MVTDTARLRAAVFEQTGIAIDENDPMVAVLVASAHQTEEIGRRLLRRTHPVLTVAATGVAVLLAAAGTAALTWNVAQSEARAARAEWAQQQRDPRIAALIASAEGRAGLRLAELGVARMLASCSGRSSWRAQDGYCVPVTSTGQPDGFKVAEARGSESLHAK